MQWGGRESATGLAIRVSTYFCLSVLPVTESAANVPFVPRSLPPSLALTLRGPNVSRFVLLTTQSQARQQRDMQTG